MSKIKETNAKLRVLLAELAQKKKQVRDHVEELLPPINRAVYRSANGRHVKGAEKLVQDLRDMGLEAHVEDTGDVVFEGRARVSFEKDGRPSGL
jgi:protein-disulfide isomerase-like protein with CxxC motif